MKNFWLNKNYRNVRDKLDILYGNSREITHYFCPMIVSLVEKFYTLNVISFKRTKVAWF